MVSLTRRKLTWISWIGHVLRKRTSDIAIENLFWTPEGKRRRWRPRTTWRRSRKKSSRPHSWPGMKLGRWCKIVRAGERLWRPRRPIAHKSLGWGHRLRAVSLFLKNPCGRKQERTQQSERWVWACERAKPRYSHITLAVTLVLLSSFPKDFDAKERLLAVYFIYLFFFSSKS